jgi:hypothetical protein
MNSLQCMMCQSSSYEHGKEKLKEIPFLRFHLLYLMRRVLVVPLLAVLLLLPAVRWLDVQASMLQLLLPPAVIDVHEAEQAIKLPVAGATAELHVHVQLHFLAALPSCAMPSPLRLAPSPATSPPLPLTLG